MSHTFDVIVIGSGIGGLTAALTAARYDKTVLLLEAGKQFGGYLNPFQRGKFHFDPGLHYIGECGPDGRFRALLDKLGLQDMTFHELNPEGFDNYRFPEYEVTMGKGLNRFAETLMTDFPKERDGLARFFDLVHKTDEALRALMRAKGFVSFLKMAPHLPFFIRWGKATLGEILDHYFKDPNLKAALSGPCGDIGLPPSKLHGLIHLSVLLHYSGGGYFPHGGTKRMRDIYVQHLEAHGVEMKRFTTVDKILTEGNRVIGVTTEKGEEFRGRTVISNVQADVTYGMLDSRHIPRKLQRKTDKLEYSLGSVCMFLGVRETCDTGFIGDKNIWHYSSNDIDALYDDIYDGALPDGSSFFLSCPSHKDPAGHSAPEGHYSVELVTLAHPKPFEQWEGTRTMKRGEEYEAVKETMAANLMAAAEQYIPGLAEATVTKEISTPVTNFSFVRTPQGNIYGPAQTPDQSGPWRFDMKGPVEGLFLCGASVISAGIVPCAASGLRAGRASVRHLNGIA
ncbi:MAG: NAD(P)/FAD-dependent oxidoreductase [Acidobacteriota bacterium]|nr:NAD(P)/FAD-dependent oxidoreductase [Acidobacteriota bacterium]